MNATLDYAYHDAIERTFSGASVRRLDRLFDRRLPERRRDPAKVVDEVRTTIFRHAMRASHPRLFGLFNPAPLPVAAFAEMTAAFLNQSLDIWKAAPAATHVEIRLIRWINDLIGFGRRAFGVFTAGGGIANTIALKIARDRALGAGARRRGISAARAGRLRVYASDQAHFSIARSLDVLGVGEQALVKIESDGSMKMRPPALAEAIRRDRRRGLTPMAVVATAGTTSTGSIDPLAAVARISRRERIHCHVDAAYGGALIFSNRFRDRLSGLELGDSVTIDPHKWLFQPFSLGGLFVRDGASLNGAFRIEPGYLKKDLEREPERLDFYHYSIEGSRPFRGLKLWFTLQALGRRGLGDLVDRTMETAVEIERQVGRLECFELHPAPVELGSVCFRYLPAWARGRPAEARMCRVARGRLDRVQTALQQEIERRGRAWFPVIALRRGVFFRLGVFNYRTGSGDVETTLRLIREAATRLKVG